MKTFASVWEPLHLMPMSERNAFVRTNGNFLFCGNGLAKILSLVPIDERIELAVFFREKIKNAYQLREVLIQLESKDYLQLVESCQEQVQFFTEFLDFIALFPEHLRMSLVLLKHSLVMTFSDVKLNEISKYLPLSAQYHFGQCFPALISVRTIAYIGRLPLSLRLELACLYQEKSLGNLRLFFQIQHFLPSDAQFEFVLRFLHLVTTSANGYRLIQGLEPVHRAPMVMRLTRIFTKLEDIVRLFALVPSTNRLELAVLVAERILIIDDLLLVTKGLNSDFSPKILMHCPFIFSNHLELAQFLAVVAEEHQLGCFKYGHSCLMNVAELILVLKSVGVARRYDCARNGLNLIKSADDFIQLISFLNIPKSKVELLAQSCPAEVCLHVIEEVAMGRWGLFSIPEEPCAITQAVCAPK